MQLIGLQFRGMKMFRRVLTVGLHCSAALLAAFTVFVARSEGRAAERPNILFIMSDDHAYQAIGAYGSQINKTPHIDRIAAEGMRFDRCYVTNSICGPSRACILTGKYSHKNGFYDNRSKFDGSQDNASEVAAAGRLPDGDRRQVAPRERADRIRLLGDPAGTGRLLRTQVHLGQRHADRCRAT